MSPSGLKNPTENTIMVGFDLHSGMFFGIPE
jgi:hypothetical protein